MPNLKPATGHAVIVSSRRWLLLLLLIAVSASALAQTRVYELRTYHCYEGKLEALKPTSATSTSAS